MEGLVWLVCANIAVWLGLGGYLARLGLKTAALEKRLQRVEYAADSPETSSRPYARTDGENS
jgi:CcmD family protein